MNFNVFKFYFFAKNFQHSLRTFPACHAFAPVSLASHIDHASISAFPARVLQRPELHDNFRDRILCIYCRYSTEIIKIVFLSFLVPIFVLGTTPLPFGNALC